MKNVKNNISKISGNVGKIIQEKYQIIIKKIMKKNLCLDW